MHIDNWLAFKVNTIKGLPQIAALKHLNVSESDKFTDTELNCGVVVAESLNKQPTLACRAAMRFAFLQGFYSGIRSNETKSKSVGRYKLLGAFLLNIF